MARKKKKGVLPRVEVIIVLVFFLCFIVWAMSKCDTKKTFMEQLATEQAEEEEAEENAESESLLNSLQANDPERPVSESRRQTVSPTSSPPIPTQVIKEYKTKLYVTIDGLKFRNGPSMDSSVIMTLPIHQELDFMNEVSDSTEQISLGNGVIANERWVKVQHWKGHQGWVYGAGINYFKLSQ